MSGPARTFWLSMHVPYACRHAGACCSSGWPIPIERPRVEPVALLGRDAWLRPAAGAPPDVAGLLALSNTGHCVFHRDGCEIQHAFGHRALPSACQHFPRTVVIDPRGTFVTLSHYCPTAADLLFTHEGPVAIVEGPRALPEGEPEGLDARDVLPPVLAGDASLASRHRQHVLKRARWTSRPGAQIAARVLMDWEGYTAWEERMVNVLANSALRPADALAQLECDLRELQGWRPGAESLRMRIERLPTAPQSANHRSYGSAHGADRVIGRFLASRAFASWRAFGEQGVRAVLAQLHLTLAVVLAHHSRRSLKEAIRHTDLELIHRADTSRS